MNSEKIRKIVVRFLALTLPLVEKIIEHKAFRPFAVVVLLSFFFFNVLQYAKDRAISLQENRVKQEKATPIKIKITEDGKILDVDQIQIVEKRFEAGDNLLNFLLRLGIDQGESFNALEALKKVFSPKDIVVGNKLIVRYKVKIRYDENGQRLPENEISLSELKIIISRELEYVVRANSQIKGGFKAEKIQRELVRKVVRHVGEIENGLFVDAVALKASPNAVMNMIALYGYSVDFQRDIQKGDKFEILVERFYTKNGARVRDGEILYSNLELRGRKLEMYAFEKKKGQISYYDENGANIKRSLLRTPVNGARISSGFGYRKHPVLGYSKLHKGVDFAAPRGTPVYAAGDGVIEYRARYGSYGNFVRIRHDSRYKTAYAHLKGFNRRFAKGSRVKQGDVIAYVGTTGRSTGPHLHFEVLLNGKAINPSKVKATSTEKLKGSDLKKFKQDKIKIDELRQNSVMNVD